MSQLRQLRYFVALAEEGHMTRAARMLGIAQPALSQAMSQLESQLGVVLFVRHAHGITLTRAGEAYFAKACTALAAVADADLAVQPFVRSTARSLVVGFIGPPPMVKAPELFMAFARQHPAVEVSFRELTFPRGPTPVWLEGVDVAFSHLPDGDPAVLVQVVDTQPRFLIMPHHHRLAQQNEMTAADALDEVFISYHPDVQRAWAGFHTLDDHRGRPPANTTGDRPLTPPEMLSIITARRGVTALSASDAAVVLRILRGVVGVELRDADHATLALSWHRDNRNPAVAALSACAASGVENGAPVTR